MISHATIIGRSHRLMQQNCHDFALIGTPSPNCAFGIVLDGCGSKYRDETGTYTSHNEVGAKLLGQFTAVYLTHHLPNQDLDEIFFKNLYAACTNYLHSLLYLLPAAHPLFQTRFIATHLLCTVVGFLVKDETAVFFWRGDGYLLHNDEIIHLDNNNRPNYLAYDLENRNGQFQTQTIPMPSRMAVATDGWSNNLFMQLCESQSTIALQRWLNIQAKERSNFEDDGAIAIWWQEP